MVKRAAFSRVVQVVALLAFALPTHAEIPGATPVAPGSAAVVWVFGHPDDETLAAAGAIHEHEEVGRRNIVIIVDSGEGSRACERLGLTRTQCGQARRYESRVAIASLGVAPQDIHHLGWQDWNYIGLIDWLDDFILNDLGLVPDQVSLKGHSPADHYAGLPNGHPDHYQVALALRTMNLRTTNRFHDVRYYRIGHLYGEFTCGVGGEGRTRFLDAHWYALKNVARREYEEQDFTAGRYGVGGESVPTLWAEVADPATPECWERPEDIPAPEPSSTFLLSFGFLALLAGAARRTSMWLRPPPHCLSAGEQAKQAAIPAPPMTGHFEE